MCKRGIFLPSSGRFWRCMAVGREGLEAEYGQKCMVTDLSAFQVGDGLGHACTVRVSRMFWVSTADMRLKGYYSTLIRDEHETAVCLMK